MQENCTLAFVICLLPLETILKKAKVLFLKEEDENIKIKYINALKIE